MEGPFEGQVEQGGVHPLPLLDFVLTVDGWGAVAGAERPRRLPDKCRLTPGAAGQVAGAVACWMGVGSGRTGGEEHPGFWPEYRAGRAAIQ